MISKHFISKLPQKVIKRGFNLFYKSLAIDSKAKDLQFEETMDQLIRALEQGLHLG